MKRLFKNITLLICIVLATSIFINFFTPFYWGDYTQTTKILHYQSNPSRYNAIFFGGSLEYRHINPAVVDAVAKQNNISLSSFNAGVDGHNIIQELRDMEGILKIKNPELKYVFISLSSEPYFYKPNRNTEKWISWQSLSAYINAVKILPTLDESWNEKGRFIWYYTVSFVKKNFNLGLLPALFQSYLDRPELDAAYLGKNKDGFFPYDDEEHLLIENYKWADETVLESNMTYKKGKTMRDSLTNSIRKSFNEYNSDMKPNKAELNILLDIIKKYAKKGIDVYFILPPRARTSYSFLLPIYYKLPKDRCIELANPDKYPEFYTLENGYNYHHLNKKGANIYSNKLASKIAELLNKNKVILKDSTTVLSRPSKSQF